MDQFKQNLKLYILFGICYEASTSLYMPFMAKFLDRLGGTAFDITILNVLRGLIIVLCTLPFVYYIHRKNDKKKSIINLLLFQVLALFAISLSNIYRTVYSPYVFLVLVAILYFPISGYAPSFQDFTAEVFPIKRADVIAKKNMYTIIFTTLATVLTGVVFKFFSAYISEVTVYQVVFLLSGFLTFFSIIIFKKFDYVSDYMRCDVPMSNSLFYVMKDKVYRNFIISFTIFSFGWTMGWPLFSIYTIKNLGADELWVSLLSVASTFAMFIGHIIWPKVIARIGEGKVAFISTFGMSITPIFYAISSSLYTLLFVSLIIGFSTAGTVTVLFAELLRVSPRENRFLYTAYYNIFINLMLSISPFIGQYIASTYGIVVALYVTAFFRLLGSFAFFLRRN